MKKHTVTAVVSHFANDQANKSHSLPTRTTTAIINEVDGNMNKLHVAFPLKQYSQNIVNSDEENYINRQNQYSTFTSARKVCNSNSTNNNEPSKIDVDDIRGHLWYHGSIGRSEAEALVNFGHPGEFLVRDCISRAGNYVLTCKWNGTVLHFMINRTIQASRAQFQFEDESYQSVPDLIRAYVGQKKPVTEESQCVISRPLNRSPFDSLVHSKSSSNSTTLRQTVSEKSILLKNKILDEDREQGNYVRMRITKGSSESPAQRTSIRNSGIANLKIPRVPESIRNRPLPPVPQAESPKHLSLRDRVVLKEARRNHLNKWRSESALEDDQGRNSSKSISPPKEETEMEIPISASLQSLDKPRHKLERSIDEPTAPAKPKRAPSLKNKEKFGVVVKDGTTGKFRELSEKELKNDGDYLDEDEEYDYHEYCDIDYEEVEPRARSEKMTKIDKSIAQSPTRTPPSLPPRSKPAMISQDRDSACVPDMILYDRPSELCKPCLPQRRAAETDKGLISRLSPSSRMLFEPSLVAFASPLLPSDTKPLDRRVWPWIRDYLLNSDAHFMATAATSEDIAFMALSLDSVPEYLLSALTFLPNGAQFRRDLLERANCLRFLVMSSLLCVEPLDTRVKILAKWIDVANIAMDGCGNYFLFENVMGALLSPSISSLATYWSRLSLDFPKQATAFTSSMKSQFWAMQPCQNVSQNEFGKCIVPNLEHVLRLMDIISFEEMILFGEQEEEHEDDIYNLDSFWHSLQHARQLPSTMRRLQSHNSRHSYATTQAKHPSKSLDIFKTEFQQRYLFGNKGSTVPAKERYSTFQRILNAMALNIESCQ